MKPAKKEESSQSLALKALRAINKSFLSALQLDEVPVELLCGEHVDLDIWTMLLKDHSLKILSKQPPGCYYFVDASQNKLCNMFKHYAEPRQCMRGLLSLSVVGAKEITDYGLANIASRNPNLTKLNISSCTKISDAGLREIGMNCVNLQELIISGCHGIEGSGLVALAECGPNLIKLDVSSAKSIQRWSLAKVFYHCRKLEDVNVSYNKDICDDELRVLAQNCAHMLSLTAIECPCVSDQTVLALSQHCVDLDFVDVSRSQMTFRITDVCLLALGQRSQSLRVLRLSGCDHLSDVGLSWLSEGCRVLEELDLCGCIKITDAGLRSIGRACHALTALDISQAKLVSDMGLASVSTGCHKLRKLVTRGLYLLSDPRFSAPKKGEKVEAWQAVVGIPALAMSCPLMQHVDLSGCFRLNIALQHHLSGLDQIKTLILCGCNQASSDAWIAMAVGCPLIEELNLSDCGSNVNNSVITAFATNCKGINNLILHRLENIGSKAIKAVATLKQLEKLDLTGCKTITDIMLVHICEVDTVPLLRNLILVSMPKVTDTTLAWLASKAHNVQLVAMKHTGISKYALQAVRDRFPNSDMLVNDNFTGFWPKFRVEDRKLMNHYHAMNEGLVKIQSRLRKVQAKVIVANLSESRRRLSAILALQRSARVFRAMRIMKQKRKEHARIQHAAVMITSLFWMFIARKQVRQRKAYLAMVRSHKLAMLIQVTWRIHRDYGIRMERLRKWLAWEDRRCAGAIVMQSLGRMYFAKNRVYRIKAMVRARALLVDRKSVAIQRAFRGHTGRIIANIARKEYHRIHVLKGVSASKIQFAFRRHRTKVIVAAGRQYCLMRWRCCVQIQSVMRGALARLRVAEMMTDQVEGDQHWAATKIQSRWRVKKARIEMKKMITANAQLYRLKCRSVLVIQNAARNQLAWRAYQLRRAAYIESIRLAAEIEINSAIKIQSCFRGMKGRLYFDDLIRQRKGKWKELFDDEKGKRFFYNKTTGEIRWRMPQDLLDLIPHPICDNCKFYEAGLECAVCNEVYCHQCFEQVHFGGRRKDHEFRTLYDFYGKRLDYGDGGFPCKWPTEVIQDEVQGWMLRVAPIRDPVAVHGDHWEEYREIEINGKSGRHFFFNRNTFETTYDKPSDVQNEEDFQLQQYHRQQQQQQQHSHTAQVDNGYYDDDGNWIENWGTMPQHDYSQPQIGNGDNTEYWDNYKWNSADMQQGFTNINMLKSMRSALSDGRPPVNKSQGKQHSATISSDLGMSTKRLKLLTSTAALEPRKGHPTSTHTAASQSAKGSLNNSDKNNMSMKPALARRSFGDSQKSNGESSRR